jgi:hypothetical protein
VKRISILFVLLLAMVVAACSSDQASPSADSSIPATLEATPEPTPEATPEESEDGTAGPSFSFGGTDSALLDLLPDSLAGNARTDVDLTDFPAFTAALEGQGMSADDVEYVISTWGTGDDVVTATAMRIPGIDRPGLEQMARMMTGAAQGEGSADVVTLGGKEVLAISAVNQGETGYMYFVGDGVFIIGSSSEDNVAELLSQLP